MSMTMAQKKTYEQLISEQVGWPPLFEADNGAVVVVLTVSFVMPSGWGSKSLSYFPSSVDLEAVRIEADGTHTTLSEATLVCAPIRRR